MSRMISFKFSPESFLWIMEDAGLYNSKYVLKFKSKSQKERRAVVEYLFLLVDMLEREYVN